MTTEKSNASAALPGLFHVRTIVTDPPLFRWVGLLLVVGPPLVSRTGGCETGAALDVGMAVGGGWTFGVSVGSGPMVGAGETAGDGTTVRTGASVTTGVDVGAKVGTAAEEDAALKVAVSAGDCVAVATPMEAEAGT